MRKKYFSKYVGWSTVRIIGQMMTFEFIELEVEKRYQNSALPYLSLHPLLPVCVPV